MEFCLLIVWCCLGITQEGYRSIGNLEKLVWKAYFEYLDFGATLCDVDYLEEEK